MSDRVITVPCPTCHGAAELTVRYEVIPREPRTWSSPGNPAYVNVLAVMDRECSCVVRDIDLALDIADLLTRRGHGGDACYAHD